MAARLQLAAREELLLAMRARVLRRSRSGDTRGQRVAYSRYRMEQLRIAFALLGPGGPFVRPDGSRDEDHAELRYVTSGVADAIRRLRTALADLREPAASHVRRALKLAEQARAVREGK
jgi:hypothetical protein